MWVQGQGHQEGMAKYPGAMPHKPEEGEGGMVTRIWRAAAISKGLMIEASMENSAAPNPSLAGVCEVSAPISLCFCLSFFFFFFVFAFQSHASACHWSNPARNQRARESADIENRQLSCCPGTTVGWEKVDRISELANIQHTYCFSVPPFPTFSLLEQFKEKSEVAQSCPTLCNPMDCNLPGYSVHGIFHARILEWVTISFFRGSFWPRDWTQISHIEGRHFTIWATREARA